VNGKLKPFCCGEKGSVKLGPIDIGVALGAEIFENEATVGLILNFCCCFGFFCCCEN
jgi:hypothetical protein